MSDSSGSGRDNRTVVRPNPGGRRPATPPPSSGNDAAWLTGGQSPPGPPIARPPGSPAQGGWPPAGGGWPGPAAPAQPFPGAPPYPTGQTAGEGEEWIANRAVQRAEAAPPRRPLLGIDDLSAPNPNPLMQAAAPLLLLLGRLRAALVHVAFGSLMEQVAQAILKFEADAKAAGIPEDQVAYGKYLLSATADDVVQNIPAEDRHEWAWHHMLARFFGERLGGVRFFDVVERSKSDPVTYFQLLELEHACLALGFQGRYRHEGGGFAVLQQIQRSIYEALRRVRPRVPRDLSPNWQGQSLAVRRARLRVPVWVVAAAAALLLFGLYVVLRYLLGGGAEAVAGDLVALNPRTPIGITRKAPAPPPPPPKLTATRLTQLQRIRLALAPEIKAGTIVVPDPTGPKWIVIDVGDTLLFNSGEATLIPRFTPLADRIRTMLEHETGTIGIVGHTDNTPLSPASPFKSNFDLSVARARNVSTALARGFSQPDRFNVEGRGADDPIADNKTEAGRRRNRRVEILVQQTD